MKFIGKPSIYYLVNNTGLNLKGVNKKFPGLDLNSASRTTAAPEANGGENVGRGRRCDL